VNAPVRGLRPVLAFLAAITVGAVLAGAAEPAPRKAGGSSAAKPAQPLRICLVSGTQDDPADLNNASLAGLDEHLRREPRLRCELLTLDAAGTGSDGIERLLEADAAVFLVRRRSLAGPQFAVVRRFFESGKGCVVLGTTSGGWENWPGFDVEVIGARRDAPPGGFGAAERLLFRPHPIWDGVTNSTKLGVALTTRRELDRHVDLAPDTEVILEGETARGRTPVAWTRTRGEARLVYVGLGQADEVAQPGYRRMVRNALYWVTRTTPPAEAVVARKSED
jgi:hypothetical protein